MSRWARIKTTLKRWDRSSHTGPGEIFDRRTYRGPFFFLLFSCATTYFLWQLDEIYAWLMSVLGVPYEINRAKQSWAQLWALILGGMGVAGAIMGMIAIPLNRYRARKSAQGQWYDQPGLTAEELRGTSPREADNEQPSQERNPDAAHPADH